MYSYRYPRAALTVDAIVLAKSDNSYFILLIRRGAEPFKDKWALPGGFINMDETLEIACRRELEEETGIKVENLKQFRTFDAVTRDPRGRTISVVFYSYIENQVDVLGNDDAAEARWFPIKNLPELAFDHQEIISLFLDEKKVEGLS